MNIQKLVNTFCKKFGFDYNGVARELPEDVKKYRCNLLEEECQEYVEAVSSGDLCKQFDALCDIVYVAIGNAILQGFRFNKGFKRVHKSNMKKKRVTDLSQSKRNHLFDVYKPEGWKAPKFEDLIK